MASVGKSDIVVGINAGRYPMIILIKYKSASFYSSLSSTFHTADELINTFLSSFQPKALVV